jgi:predicted metal-binding protein
MENIDQGYSDLVNLFMPMAKEEGADIAIPIFTKDIVFDFRATYQCLTCSKYGKSPMCPPNIPDVDYFSRLLSCYKYGLLVAKKYNFNAEDFDCKREESGPRVQNILLFLEQQAFQRNYYWALSFTGGSCRMCQKCSDTNKCQMPSKGRIPLEAIGVDVMATCKKYDIPISTFPLKNQDGVLYRVGLFLLE